MISKNVRIWTYSMIRKNSMISSRIRKYTAGSGTEQDKEFSISRYSKYRKYSRIRKYSARTTVPVAQVPD
jgi:hypothetical protein